MRVTQQQLINNFLNSVNSHNSKLLNLNNQISSGKAVQRPQDGAVAAAAITRLQANMAETKQFEENIKQSLSRMNTVDATLGDISSIITRARELAVQGANGALSLDERDAIAVEVNQLLESMVQIGNTTIGGRALFGGHETAGKPFDVIRGSDLGEVKDLVTIDGEVRTDINLSNVTRVVYNGDSQDTAIEVDQALAVVDNLHGADLFYYDERINNSGPSLSKKAVQLTGKTELSTIINGLGSAGIAAGMMTVRTTRAPHLRENTSTGADNSTRLALLNNRQGVNTANGNQITVTDAAGNALALTVGAGPGQLNISGATRIEEVVTALNGAITPETVAGHPRVRFRIENDQIAVYDFSDGAGQPTVSDNVGNLAQGLNLTRTNPDFSRLPFDEDTQLRDWLGVADGSWDNPGPNQLRLQDAAGVETFLNLPDFNDTATVGDLINQINNSGARVKAQISPNGYGLRFINEADGSGNFFVEDNTGTVLTQLNQETPERGAKDTYDATNQVLVDLSGIGNTIHTVDELLQEINSQTASIGVEASLDPVTSELVFQDTRIPGDRGKFRVNIANAIGKNTELATLNDGGGINNFKIRITDSTGISQVVDFEDAKTVEDVINAINLRYEPMTEQTSLGEIEGLGIPMGTLRFTTTSGTTDVDLSALTAANTVKDLENALRTGLATSQVDVATVFNPETRGLQLSFADLALGDGSISIQSVGAPATADQLKISTIAGGKEFTGETMLHKRVAVRAMLNDDRTGIKLIDDNGGAFSVAEVEGRTTGYDLGLIPQGTTNSTSNTLGVMMGRDLNVFSKVADQLGLSTAKSTKVFEDEDTIAAATVGALENTYFQTRSMRLKTRELSTLKGSVDLNPQLNRSTRLELLNNASANPDWDGGKIRNVDLTGQVQIEIIADDDADNNYDSIVLDFNQLPDNATWDDVQTLINQQIAADDSFRGKVNLHPTNDGKIRFSSDVAMRFSEVAATQNANTFEDLFGSSAQSPSDFNLTHETIFVDAKLPTLGGVDVDSFYLNEVGSGASLEVDLKRIERQLGASSQSIQLGDVLQYIEDYATVPATLSTSTSLKDMNVSVPTTIGPFNLTEGSTLGDFITAFNGSAMFPNVSLAIASDQNSPTGSAGKRLVLATTNGSSYISMQGISSSMARFLEQVGIAPGGQTSIQGLGGAQVIVGRQISGLGFSVDTSIDENGQFQLAASGRKDADGNEIANSGKIRVSEGSGTAARDLKILQGTGALGDTTRFVSSGNLNPSVDRHTLLSEMVPNADGQLTSFEEQLKSLYVENGKESAFIDLKDSVPVTMDTPLKAFNSGAYDGEDGIYRGGVDVGRKNSGFVIKDQFGNEAIVDLSNNQSANSQSNLEKEYNSKPFYDRNSTLEDVQTAINIAIDKARRTHANFGVESIKIELNDAGGYQLAVSGPNGPTISIDELDANGDGTTDSTTARDLGLLRETGAKGNGSPQIEAGPIDVAPTLTYLMDAVNKDLSRAGVTMSLGTSPTGPTLDLTSNSDSSYMKVRDTREGNTASQVGLTATRSIFQTMIDLRDALQRDDADFISEEILAKIGEDEEKVLKYRARIGSVVNRFESNVERLETTNIELTKRLSENQDIDMVQAIIDLRQVESAQQASLNIGARIIQVSLLDFLG